MLWGSIVLGGKYKISSRPDSDNSYHHFNEGQVVEVTGIEEGGSTYVKCVGGDSKNPYGLQWVMTSDLDAIES